MTNTSHNGLYERRLKTKRLYDHVLNALTSSARAMEFKVWVGQTWQTSRHYFQFLCKQLCCLGVMSWRCTLQLLTRSGKYNSRSIMPVHGDKKSILKAGGLNHHRLLKFVVNNFLAFSRKARRQRNLVDWAPG